jgi:hypothetical protein
MKMKMKMKTIILTIFVFSGVYVKAQFDPVFYNIMIPHDKVETIKDMLKKEGVELSFENLPYVIVDFENERFFINKRGENSRIRGFKILRETSNIYLLCSDNVELCDCKANTFIYNKKNNQLQRIERPFSFSLKRNLIKRLEDMDLNKPIDYKNMTFCEMLKELN